MTLAVRVEPAAHACADRTGALFPKVQLCAAHQLLLVGRVLGDVELRDEVQHLLRDGRCRQRFVEVAAQMRVAGRASSRRDLVDDVVAAVAIDEQQSLRAFEQGLRRRAGAILGEDVRDIEAAIVVARVEGPDEAVLGLAALVAHDA
jgi:hypothetical protein